MSIQLHKTEEYTFLQSPYPNIPQQPCRALFLGPSGCGKTRCIVSLLVDLWRTKSGKSIFERIFVFSPSVHIDATWKTVERFNEKVLKVPKDEQTMFADWDEKAIQHIIDTQSSLIEHQKKLGMSRLYGICLVLDDWADAPHTRHSRALQQLFVRGRHSGITTICSLQRLRVVNPVVRVNAGTVLIWRLRSAAELDTILEEYGAVYGRGKEGREVVHAIYEEATRGSHDFLMINTLAKKREDLFWRNFDERLIPDINKDAGPTGALRGNTERVAGV